MLAATCRVNTDANAANRILSVDYLKTGGATYVRNLPTTAITASTVTLPVSNAATAVEIGISTD